MSPEQCWYKALASQCGVVLTTAYPAENMKILYEHHRMLADPDLNDIRIVVKPEGLWLYKQSLAPTVKGRHYKGLPTNENSH